MNEFLEQFLIESRELIGQAADDLLALEHQGKNAARFDSLFRAIHTLKGAAGIMDFDAMGQLCHAAEDRLSAVRSSAEGMTPALVTDCLACLDQITAWLDFFATNETPPVEAMDEAAAIVARLGQGAGAEKAALPASPVEAGGAPGIPAAAAEILHEQIELLALPQDDGSAGRVASSLLVIRNILQSVNLSEAVFPPANDAAQHDAASASRPMRVDIARIDALMRLSGELVVLKNALGHCVEQALQAGLPRKEGQNLLQIQTALDRLSADLLRASVAARVLPLRQVFQRFSRLIREMAGAKKKIRLVTQGDGTEADRLLVESLFEPVLHCLRNAVDHGVEPAAERERLGKPIPAIIRLTGARLGEEVIVEIADDGRGIDPAAIRATAEKRGLASATDLAAMSEDALLELIFAPGFSTAGTVSTLSGRGVGMDAVRAAVEALGGRVSVETRLGAGTAVRFHLPYTVLLTRVLSVEAGGQAFGIPFEAVKETLRLHRAQVARMGATDTVLWRGQTLPLLSLAELLLLPDTAIGETLQAVITPYEGDFIALKVERLGRQLDVMLKPLDGLLARTQNVAGTALLGDGRVLIVLEMRELLK